MPPCILPIRIILSTRNKKRTLLAPSRRARTTDYTLILSKLLRLLMNLPGQCSKVLIQKMPASTSAKKPSKLSKRESSKRNSRNFLAFMELMLSSSKTKL